jgi:preprotein translocase subunit SecD
VAPPSRNGPKPFRVLAAVIVIMLVSVLGKETFSPRNWDHQVKAGLGLDLSSGTQVVLKVQPGSLGKERVQGAGAELRLPPRRR